MADLHPLNHVGNWLKPVRCMPKSIVFLAVFVVFSILMAAPAMADGFSVTPVKSWGKMIIDIEDPFILEYDLSSIIIDPVNKFLTIDGRFSVPANTSGNLTIPAGNKYLGFSFNATLSDGDIWYRDYGSQDPFVHLGPADFSYKASTHGYDHVYYISFASIPAGTNKEFRLNFYFDEKPDSFVTYFGTNSTALKVTENTNVEINNSYYSIVWDEDGCSILNFLDITTNREWVGQSAGLTHPRMVGNETDPLFAGGVAAHATTVMEQSDVHMRLKCGSDNDWVYFDCYAEFPYCFFNYSISEVVYAEFYFPPEGQEAFMLGANFTTMDTDGGVTYNQVDRGFMSTNLSTVNRSFTILFDKEAGTKYVRLSDNAGSDALAFLWSEGDNKELNLNFNWWSGLTAYSNGNMESLNDTIMFIESTMSITNTDGSCVEQSNGTHIFDCTTDDDNVLSIQIHQNNTNITDAYFKVRFYANNTNGEFAIYNSSTGTPTEADLYVLINDTGTFDSDGASIADSNADNLTDMYAASNSIEGAVMKISFSSDIYLTVNSSGAAPYIAEYDISFIDEITNNGIDFSANKNGTLTYYCSEKTEIVSFVNETLNDFRINCTGTFADLKYIKFTLYDPNSDHYRTLIPTTNSSALNFYMINTTPADVTINLVTYLVTDASLLYQNGIMHFKKIILEAGQEDIIDTTIGSDGKVYANLIAGETYTISVESEDGTNSKTLGEYTVPDSTTTSQPLTIIDVRFIPTTYNYIGTDISWEMQFNTSMSRIYFYWNDSTGDTNEIKFWIYNITNVSARTQMYYDTVSGQSHHLFQWDYVTNGNENDTYLGYFEVDHDRYDNITESRPLAKGGIFYQWLGNIGAWYHIISVFIIVFVASIFGAKSAPIGAVILSIIAGFLFYIEWLPAIMAGALRLTDLLMLTLIALAILAMFIVKRRRI